MKIKLIAFDLDGVLVEAKQIHYDALNLAISEIAGEHFAISASEHMSTYDGLKTSDKLNLLSKNKGLSISLHKNIWAKKQAITLEKIFSLEPSQELKDLCLFLRDSGYKLACCSNSVKATVENILSKLELINFFDVLLSNEDVINPKPHPEIYWSVMSKLRLLPEETLIIEDSPVGLLAAHRSSANVLRVTNSKDVSLDKILSKIDSINNNYVPKWQGDKMNILVPMAGAGSRFSLAGYTFPKPLISVHGKPMIQLVIENLNIGGNYIFIVQKQHKEKYNLDVLLNLICPNCKVVEVDGVTEGAACTTLLAKEFIDNNDPLLIANCDQILDWNSNEFMYKMNEQKVDGGIVTFTDTHPKLSFVKIDEYGYVTEVAEKKPISNIATVGLYYWTRGKEYVEYAEKMIASNDRVNNEFYVCPVYTGAIEAGKKIKTFGVDKMWGIGTPEDLAYFLENRQ